jgi:RNA ligase (TIGR02306 family)
LNSTHKVEIVPVTLTKHDNADSLSIIPVFGYSYVGRTEEWLGKSLAAYLPPDSVVDVNRPEFSFLAKDAKANGKVRIKAKKLRGVLSFGLMVPVPDDTPLGDDWAERLGVEHYDPDLHRQNPNRGGLFMGGEVAAAPPVYSPKYDLEAGRRYATEMFEPGEPVLVTEKIHGTSARYVFVDGTMYCGSRTEWKKEYPDYSHVTVESLLATGKVDEARAQEIVARLSTKGGSQNLWWQALDATPSLRKFCELNPGIVVYGEVYGAVQDLNYGKKKGEVAFAAFDLMVNGRWADPYEARNATCEIADDFPWVPHVPDSAKFDFDAVCSMAEGPSLVPGANHVREGVVVKPLKERVHPRHGRVALKWVGAGYLEKSK